jgi:hypothetical protein
MKESEKHVVIAVCERKIVQQEGKKEEKVGNLNE